MDWLRRIGRSPGPTEVEPEGEPPPQPIERSSPGVAALLEGVVEDRSHAVLDLGPASDASLRVYSRYARWVRFANLLGADPSVGAWTRALDTVPPQPERPYDLIFAWDVLDQVEPEARPGLIARLSELTSPDARLYVVVETADSPVRTPLRFSLLDSDRMRYAPSGPPRAAWAPILPAEIERLLAPFKVMRAFSSQLGLREYVAIRQGR